jgi:hypothetical protein
MILKEITIDSAEEYSCTSRLIASVSPNLRTNELYYHMAYHLFVSSKTLTSQTLYSLHVHACTHTHTHFFLSVTELIL